MAASLKVKYKNCARKLAQSIQAPLIICVYIHGQYTDLLRIFERGGYPPKNNCLFLGDYVNRGCRSIETITLLLAFKIKYKDTFFLLRGNHECHEINSIYGFHEECQTWYNTKIWKVFNDCFDCLPVAAITAQKIFCCHGGLSPDLHSMNQIEQIARPTNVPEGGLLCGLLWPDPEKAVKHWGKNDRGVSYTFAPKTLTKFSTNHYFDLVCHGHQGVDDGYEFSPSISWSAPDYCGGEFDSAGAVMMVGESLVCFFHIMKPRERRKRKKE